MRILITGGSGYIGSHIIARLVERKAVDDVVCIDLKAPPLDHAKLTFVERSVTEDLTDIFTGRPIDIALHLAWLLDPLFDVDRQRAVCIGGTQRFLDGCVAGDVKHVYFMSSATAYGAHPDHDPPVDESTVLKHEFHFQYSAEKREGEELCRRFASDRPGTLLQIGRPCIVGGPNVSNYIFRAIDKPINFRPLGSDQKFQFVHEDDCADAIVAILDSKLPGAFNIAADGIMTMSEIYRKLSVRSVTLPVGVLRTIATTAWKHRWTQLSEAPPEFIEFIVLPWLISNKRLKDEVGFQFKYTAEETFNAFVRARVG